MQAEVERLTKINKELSRENDELRQTKGPISAVWAKRLLIENDKLLNYIASLQKEIELLRSHKKEDPKEFEEKIEALIAENQRQYLELEAKAAEIKALTQRFEMATQKQEKDGVPDSLLPGRFKTDNEFEVETRWLARIASMERENRDLMKKVEELSKVGQGSLDLLNRIQELEDNNENLHNEKTRLESLLTQKDREIKKTKDHSRFVHSRYDPQPEDKIDLEIHLSPEQHTPHRDGKRPGGLSIPTGSLTTSAKKPDVISSRPDAKSFDEDEPASLTTIDAGTPKRPQLNQFNLPTSVDYKQLSPEAKIGAPEDLTKQLDNKNKEIKALLEDNSKLKLVNQNLEAQRDSAVKVLKLASEISPRKGGEAGFSDRGQSDRDTSPGFNLLDAFDNEYKGQMRKRFEELYEQLYRAEATLSKLTQEYRLLQGAKAELEVENNWMKPELTHKNYVISELEEMLKERDEQIAILKEDLGDMPEGGEGVTECGHLSEIDRLIGQKEALDRLLQEKNAEILNLHAALDREKKEIKIRDCSHAPEIENLRDEINRLMVDQANKDEEIKRLTKLLKQPGELSANDVTEISQKEGEKDSGLKDKIQKLLGAVKVLEGDVASKETEIKKLKEELDNARKEHENHLEDLKKDSDGPKSELKEKVKELLGRIEVLEGDVAKKEGEIEELKEELDKAKKEHERHLDELKKENERLHDDLNRKDHHIKELKEEIGKLKEGIDRLGRDNERLHGDLHGKDHHIKGLREEIERLQKELPNENRDFNIEIGTLKEDLNKVQAEAEHLKDVVDKRDEEIEELKRQNHALEADIDTKDDKIKTLANELEKLRHDLSEEKHEKKELEDEIEKLKKEHDKHARDLKDKLGEKEKHCEDFEKENERLQGDLKDKDRHIADLKEEMEKTQNDLLNKNRDLHDEIGKLKEDFAKENERLHDKLDEKEDQIKNFRDELEKHAKEHRPHQPEVQVQEKIVERVKECDHIPEIRKLQGKVEMLEGDSSLKEGEINELKQIIQRLEGAVTDKDKKIMALHDEINRLGQDLHHDDNDLRDELHKARVEALELKDQIVDKDRTIESLIGEIAALRMEIEKHQKDHKPESPGVQIQEKIIEILKECEHAPEIKELRGKVEAMEGDIASKENEIERLKEELKQANEKIGEQDKPDEDRQKEKEGDTAELKKKIKELLGTVEVLEGDVARRDNEIADLKEEIENLKKKDHGEHPHKHPHIDIELRVGDKDKHHEGHEDGLKNKIKELTGAIEKLEGDVARKDNEIADLKEEIEDLKKKGHGEHPHKHPHIDIELRVGDKDKHHEGHKEGHEDEAAKLNEEIEKLKERLDGKKKKCKDRKNKINELQAENEQLIAEVDRLNGFVGKARGKKHEGVKSSGVRETEDKEEPSNEDINKLIEALSDRDNQINELKHHNATLDGQNQGLNNDIAALKKDLETSANDLRERNEKIQDLEDTVQRLNNEIKLIASANEASPDNLRQKLKEKAEALDKTEQGFKKAQQKINDLRKDLEAEKKKKEEELKKVDDELKEVRDKVNDLEYQNQNLRDQLRNAGEGKSPKDGESIKQLQRAKKKLEEELQKNQEEVVKLTKKLQAVNPDELEGLRKKLAEAQKQQENLKKYIVIVAVAGIALGLIASRVF